MKSKKTKSKNLKDYYAKGRKIKDIISLLKILKKEIVIQNLF